MLDRFNPGILLSYRTLEPFFHGEKAIRQIENLSLQGPCEPYGRHLLQNTWNIKILTLSGEIKRILSVFVDGIAKFFLGLELYRSAISCKVMSAHLQYNSAILKTFTVFKEQLLCPCINAHRLDSADFYTTSPLKLAAISDPAVRQIIDPPKEMRALYFYHDRGLCRGVSTWFIYLFLSTHSFFYEPRSHVIAVAKQFEMGASKEASLLQSLAHTEKDLLHLHCKEKLHELSSSELNKIPGKLLFLLKELSPNVYAINSATHRIVYIKLSNSQGFIFDPNVGALEFSGEGHIADVFDYVYRMHSPSNAKSFIYFDLFSTQEIAEAVEDIPYRFI